MTAYYYTYKILGAYTLIIFHIFQTNIRSEVTLRYPGHDNVNKIQKVNIRGLQAKPNNVTVNDVSTENFDYQVSLGMVTVLNTYNTTII